MAVFTRLFKDRAADAAKVFPTSTPEEATASLTEIASAQFIAYSTWKWLEEHARTSGKPVYRYLYARPRPPTVETGVTPNLAGGATRGAASATPAPPATGAVHSAEIEYAMGNLPLNHVFAWTPDDYKVSATMQEFFANFIKKGDPNGPAVPAWPVGAPDGSGNVQRMRIDVTSRAEPEPRPRYQFLNEIWSGTR